MRHREKQIDELWSLIYGGHGAIITREGLEEALIEAEERVLMERGIIRQS